MEDMADEVSCVNLSDDSLQACRKLASEYSISSLVNTTCSLTHIMAEENFDTTVPNRFYETLAKNDLFFQKNHIYRWKSKQHPQVCYSRRFAHHLTLPRFPLRRRWTELALPTFMAEPEVKKGQEVNEKTSQGFSKSSSLIYTSDLNSPVNSAPQGADMKAENAAKKSSELAKMEDITYTNTNVDVFEFVEDINEQKNLEGDVSDITQNNSTSSDITSLNKQDIVYAVSPPSPSQHENDYAIVEDIMRRALPPKSPEEQLQKAPMAANKHTRRGCKGVRGKIKKLFERISCCLPTRSKEYTTSSILLQSHSPPEKVEDIADEVFCVDLTDDSLQACRKLASEYSISSLVNTTCSLTHIMAEENFDTTVPNRFYETLAKNDLFFQKNHIYRWKSKQHPQVCYSRRFAHHLTLPRFPLRRRWTELALPTFMAEPEVKKGQEGADMKAENAAKKSSELAKMEDITYTNTNVDVFEFVEDINEQKNLEGDVSDITQNNSTSSDITSLNKQDIVYAVSPPSPSQHENDYAIVEDIMRRALPPKSPEEQLQKAPMAANKHTRRGCKGVRGKIKKLFERISCCLPTRSKEYTTSSILLQSHSPPEKVEDIADEVFCVDLTDDSLQACKKLASEYSISSLVNTTCSLTHIMAEENFDTTVPNRFYETLAKNDLLFQKNRIYRWKSKYHPQVCYSRRLSHRLTLPRFPLRRRWSELPLPTFITEIEVKKGQEGADMKALETPETAENAANLTSEGTPEEAKVKANRKLFGRFFCCLCMPRTKDTTSRADDVALTRGS